MNGELAMIVVAAAAPLAVFAWVRHRLLDAGARSLGAAFSGGAILGPVVAIVSFGFVVVVAGSLVRELVDPGQALLRRLQVDPSLARVLRTGWVLVLLVEVVAVAPLTEEIAKALGAVFGKPTDRRGAFCCGVAAGAGFAIVEDIIYGIGAVASGEPWTPLLAARALGSAVHPLATGLVMLGWWDWRERRDPVGLARGYIAGVTVHALWNGAQVAMIVAIVSGPASADAWGIAALAFTGALGMVALATLWKMTELVAAGGEVRLRPLSEPRTMAAWLLLSASMLVPVAFVAFLFPDFIGG